MLKQLVLGAAVCLVMSPLALSTVAFAQEPPPFAKPGPEHAKLKEVEGEWDCVMEMAGQKSKCTATYKSICGGMWIQSDFQGDLGGTKFQGHGLDGYDATKKKYTGIWVDSMSTAPMLMEGDYDEAKKTLTMTGESTNPQGKKEKFKAVTEHKDKDHMTFKMYMLDGDQENLAFTIEYTRKK